MTSRQQGFSMIEIMTVLVIIGVLAAIAIPLFHSYQVRARNTQAIADVYHLFLFENQFFDEHNEYVAIVAGDKHADGLISKNVTLSDGSTALFEIRTLTPDVQIAVNISNDRQTIVLGGVAVGSTDIIAMDPDAADGYHAIPLSGSFSESSLPASTSGNDLSAYPIYQK
ncbi:prepilin-type N-terminal cleavage/methylation domain-containing protein [Mariprofundus ferrooxydans]|uniref:prepilin-type N-terminal cleavage/methylation domain-containing protein n=1 Tax=Mariprofundus ferrooxydans TaxID=314344 RepID=UPI00035F69F4|nr:prepilin-type N-terminal cleavage/methylation domain-containing protein [Mariprofundus ferrooxydans]